MSTTAAPNELWRLLANATNRALLMHLSSGPSYPRDLARRLDASEDDVQRKLQRLERAGLLSARWRYHGKTVKEYSLVVGRVVLDLRASPPALRIEPGEA